MFPPAGKSHNIIKSLYRHLTSEIPQRILAEARVNAPLVLSNEWLYHVTLVMCRCPVFRFFNPASAI